jgi:tetratricopeptide (TPR) repeat protein
MSDSPLPDGSRAPDASSTADRDGKIEQLLLVGLDYYFAAQYDHAINIWTRALFLDRTHPRARAYIERARSALAERQRASEELLQSGVAAFQRGEGIEARRLLQAAIAGGAPSDEALAVLDRMDRLEVGAAAAELNLREPRAILADPSSARRSKSRRVVAIAAGAALVGIGAAAIYGAVSGRLSWKNLNLAVLTAPRADVPRGTAPDLARDASLPLPRRGQTALSRARALALGGHWRDALAELDNVRPTDPQKPDADRLRTEIQQQLLNLGSMRRVP